MSISQLNGQERLRATTAIAALRSNAAPAAPSPSGPIRQPDAVTISDAARSIASARTTVGVASEAREDRISAIKAAIADGTYAVDSKTLARSMVRNLGR